MRINLFAATTVALLIAAISVTNLQAQQPPSQQAPPPRGGSPAIAHGVAVIDITYILDNYARLKQASDAFKKDVEAVGLNFKKEQESFVKEAEKLKGFKPGSPDYKALEETLTKRQSDLKVNASIKEKEFGERESKIYLTAYQEVSNAVKVYAERNGISLVLRFSGAPVDQNNRDAVRAELFKTVMYNSREIDITDQILAELNRGAAIAAKPGAPGARPSPQQPPRK